MSILDHEDLERNDEPLSNNSGIPDGFDSPEASDANEAPGIECPDVYRDPPSIPDEAEVEQCLRTLQNQPLSDRHREDLRRSGLSEETIRAAGLCSADAAATRYLGFHDSAALIIPYPAFPGYVRIKPDAPRIDAKGRAIKYETLRGGVNHLYIPARTLARLQGMGEPLQTILITEGEKKALKADQEGFPTISVPGVWGWRSGAAQRELEAIDWRGRKAIIVFDSDVTRKDEVKAAISALVEHLRQLRAEVQVVLLPDLQGQEKTGLDDFLVAEGAEELRRLLEGAQDWFSTLLEMLEAELAVEALETAVVPIYWLIKKAGVVAAADMTRRLRQRLKALGYEVPSQAEIKGAIRNLAPFQPEGVPSDDREERESLVKFVAEGPEGVYAEQPERQGLYDFRPEEPIQLTNFNLIFEEDVWVEEERESHRCFRGRIQLLGQCFPFSIKAEDFANNNKLTAAIFGAAGAKIEIYCKPEVLRTAISEVSHPETRRATTSFGWNAAKDAYLVPGGRITAEGFQASDGSDGVEVDLSEQEFAKRLGLRCLEPEELAQTKRHIVEDLIPLCPDAGVSHALLGGLALSVLYGFTEGANRPLLWVAGLSGTGKSHLAKLLQNFFGDFPLAGEKSVMSWASTAKRIQHEGYFFKDAIYLVDDYKPEQCSPREATWILQSFADSAARSRLRRDATAAETREIRGLLLCTGEDVPDHSASATARMIKLDFPSGRQDTNRTFSPGGRSPGVAD